MCRLNCGSFAAEFTAAGKADREFARVVGVLPIDPFWKEARFDGAKFKG